ncbi:2-keto-4-pentenoate hydratase [Gudongella sp. DL1XJH-153]|uniref:2-keto-4-pentenoate hydratase n=1 Tax=Gudongella sp. DL1XJH-153 TaxID=3409804 RepID=UPI003BB72228
MEEKLITNEQLSMELYESFKKRKTMKPLSLTNTNLSVDDAYDIQMKNVKRAQEEGEVLSGKKIGLTSKGMQQLLNITEPDFGHLFKSMEIENGGTVSLDMTIQPKVEGEIAFVLKEDLEGPGVTIEDVFEATDYVCAAIEIVDSRIEDWQIKLVDTIADNGSSAFYVLGDNKVDINDVSLPDIEMTLYKNGEVANKGSGKEVLENPAMGAAWLANKLHDLGDSLKKGEVILSGAFTASPDAAAGDQFRCEFSELGTVEVKFK